MDEGLSPRAQEPRRPLEAASAGPSDASPRGLASGDGRDGLVLQILSTEHFSLLSQRGLVYNEAFTRVGMFLTFVSMSFVALALLSNALPSAGDLVIIAAIVLGIDLIVALATVIRVANAYGEDFVAVQAMNRVRRGYAELAPEAMPYFSTSIYDDLAGVVASYGSPVAPSSTLSGLLYGFSTSIGLLVIVAAILAGALVSVLALAAGAGSVLSLLLGAVAVFLFMVGLASIGIRGQVHSQASLVVRFPPPEGSEPVEG